MKPIDLSKATFVVIRNGLSDGRKAVYEAWVVHGPGTTRDLANKSGISILTLRPRTTDLCELGLVELVDAQRGFEGIYRAVNSDRWTAWQKDQVVGQQQLI